MYAAWIWTATDYSESEPVNENFAIRFKTPEIATGYKKAFDLAKEKTAKAADSPSKPAADNSSTAPVGSTSKKDETAKGKSQLLYGNHFY